MFYAPHGIRCNTVIPGMIDTPLLEHRVSRQSGRADLATLRSEARTRVPLGRRGDAWDVAYAALFLACDEAKYVTGTEIVVDGGLMARSAQTMFPPAGIGRNGICLLQPNIARAL